MLLNNKICADAGSVNCPCYLAEYGKCIVCSRLGADNCESGNCHDEDHGDRIPENGAGMPKCCDCSWQGVCIYNEYLQNNGCINGQSKKIGNSARSYCSDMGSTGEQRKDMLCNIQKIKWYEEDLVVMQIAAPRGFAEKAALPGSFVFVKRPGADNCFAFPVSVMKASHEEGFIELAVKVAGPKSRALLKRLDCSKGGSVAAGKATSPIDNLLRVDSEAVESPIGDLGYMRDKLSIGDDITLRGIYRNGLLGAENLKGSGLKVLCLTKGIGLAPVANYIRWSGGRDEIDVIADLEKISREFADDALCDCTVNSVTYSKLPESLSWADEEKYDVIIISASDYYQQNIYVPAGKRVLSNNHTMCCGEGVCGACIQIDSNGGVHRMCKCSNTY